MLIKHNMHQINIFARLFWWGKQIWRIATKYSSLNVLLFYTPSLSKKIYPSIVNFFSYCFQEPHTYCTYLVLFKYEQHFEQMRASFGKQWQFCSPIGYKKPGKFPSYHCHQSPPLIKTATWRLSSQSWVRTKGARKIFPESLSVRNYFF